jgi:hypothetical protein
MTPEEDEELDELFRLGRELARRYGITAEDIQQAIADCRKYADED